MIKKKLAKNYDQSKDLEEIQKNINKLNQVIFNLEEE